MILVKQGGVTHIDGYSDTTLCGLGSEGFPEDEDENLGEVQPTKAKIVTCHNCKGIIKSVKQYLKENIKKR